MDQSVGSVEVARPCEELYSEQKRGNGQQRYFSRKQRQLFGAERAQHSCPKGRKHCAHCKNAAPNFQRRIAGRHSLVKSVAGGRGRQSGAVDDAVDELDVDELILRDVIEYSRDSLVDPLPAPAADDDQPSTATTPAPALSSLSEEPVVVMPIEVVRVRLPRDVDDFVVVDEAEACETETA